MAEFRALGLAPWLAEQARQVGLLRPTPVQAACIPAVLQGRDCLGCAKTGSGKTAAFVLPVLQVLSEDPYGIFCLVLTPTRELAYQIAEQFRVLGKPLGLKDCVVVGGLDMVAQALELSRKPHVVIATPGRLADHLRSSSTFSLRKIKFLVKPWALGESQLWELSSEFQTIRKLFALIPSASLSCVKSESGFSPFFYPHLVRTVEQLQQRYLLVPEALKDAHLVHLVQNFQEQHHDWAIIIFTKTCKDCQVLNMMLRKFNFPSVALHSMMKQRQRFAALAKFKSSIFRILIATDVAARGAGLGLSLWLSQHSPIPVFFPISGRQGMAITLVTQYDIHLVHAIEDEI
ncbi:DDX49 helicase, partial [Pycnonotus jocosus]|nr:DDX49 helicase [Pycnonotus jocosus]